MIDTVLCDYVVIVSETFIFLAFSMFSGLNMHSIAYRVCFILLYIIAFGVDCICVNKLFTSQIQFTYLPPCLLYILPIHKIGIYIGSENFILPHILLRMRQNENILITSFYFHIFVFWKVVWNIYNCFLYVKCNMKISIHGSFIR